MPAIDAAELPRQHRTRAWRTAHRARILRAMVSPSIRVHDEAGAEFVLRLQHMHHARRRQAGIMRQLHQRRPRHRARRRVPATRHSPAARGAGSRRSLPSACTMSNVQVSWLAPPESFAAPVTPVAPEYQEATQRPSSVLDHLPLNLAGRFSRNAVTPSLKSSAEPAMRCDLEFEVELFFEGIFRAVPIEFSDQRQRDRRPVGEIMRELHRLFHQARHRHGRG